MTNNKKSDMELYESRTEPSFLKTRKAYINLRTCKDLQTLAKTQDFLKNLSESKDGEYVLLAWLSPPYGLIVGYGAYPIQEARQITNRYKKEEGWTFPQPGRIYDRQVIEERGKKLRKAS